MAKKLELIRTGSRTWAEPPRKLGKHGQAFWDRIMSEYDIRDSGGLEMLAQACGALDRVEECCELVEREGILIKVKGSWRENPATKIELANRAFIVRTLARLGLDVEAVKRLADQTRDLGGYQMPTNRTPINRSRIARFTPEILDAFRAMQRLEENPSPEALDEWMRLNNVISRALPALPPWRWPAVEMPEYPHWGRWGEPDIEAQELYLELERATKPQ